MSEPQVKILLEDGDRNAIWVSVCPVTTTTGYGAVLAAGEAVAHFLANLGRDEEALNKWLAGEDLW